MQNSAQQRDAEASPPREEPALRPPPALGLGEGDLDRAAQADPVGTGQGRVVEMGHALNCPEPQQLGQPRPARRADPARGRAFGLLGGAHAILHGTGSAGHGLSPPATPRPGRRLPSRGRGTP